MAEHFGHQGGRGLLSSMSCGVAGPAGLSQEELKCPICVETIQDAFVTACGHTFCYPCISTHLKNKHSCPSCSNYLTQEHIHPNFLLNKILKAAAASRSPQQPGLLDTVHAMLRREGRSRPSVADVQLAIQLLHDKQAEMESHEEWHSLQLLLLFLQHARAEKEAAAAELQRQLACLSRDLKAVSGVASPHLVAGHEQGAAIAALLPARKKVNGAGPAAAVAAAAAVPRFSQQQQASKAAMPRAVSAPSLMAMAAERAQQLLLANAGPHASPQQQQGAAGSSQRATTPQRKRKAAPPALHLPEQEQQPHGWPANMAAFSQGPTLGEGLGIGHGFKPYLAPSASPHLNIACTPAMPSPSAAADAAGDASPRLSSNGGSSGGGSGAAAGPSGRDEAGGADGARGSKKRRILSQFDELQQAYLALHAQQGQGQEQQGPPQQQQQQQADVAAAAASPSKQASPKATCAAEAAASDHKAGASNSSGAPPPPSNPPAGPATAAAAPAAPAAAPADPSPPAPDAGNEAQSPPAAQAAPSAPQPQAGLHAFHEVLAAATHYSRLQLVADVPPAVVEAHGAHGTHSGASSGSSSGSAEEGGACNVLSSIEFDMEGRVMAVAGVQQRILLYDYDSVAAAGPRSHHSSPAAPLLTMPSGSRVSCLSFSRSTQQDLLSSDYDGGVVLWDAECGKGTMQWDAHTRRIWSVDFSREEADMFATGSDDGKVRLWTTGERDALMSLDVQANVCSVQFCPEAGHLLAVGSAGHAVLLYDMRAAREPYQVLLGHGKAVSYVRWMGGNELISASTDGTLRLWDAEDGSCVRTYSGHVNSRNFVGLSVEDGLIACGSETNEVYVYCKELPRPTISYRLGGVPARRSESGDSSGGCSGGGSSECFVSAVCWKPGSNVLMAANSQGSMCALALQR